MRLNELTFKILDISFKNSLLMGYSAKVNSTPLYGSICEYLRHGAPRPGDTMWKTSRRVMDYPDPAHFIDGLFQQRLNSTYLYGSICEYLPSWWTIPTWPYVENKPQGHGLS